MKIFARLCLASLLMLPFPALAQMITAEQPVVYSKTVIAIVPGSTIPKTISQAPELRGELEAAGKTEPQAPAEQNAEAAPAPQRHTLQVEVRPDQIHLNSGVINNYTLNEQNGVLTYFTQAEPRRLLAENIQRPLDMLFITDDGIIVQIVPEIIPAYLPDDIGTDFPLRALLYLQAGQAAAWGIEPGFRIEHGMFNPRPMIYMAPEKAR